MTGRGLGPILVAAVALGGVQGQARAQEFSRYLTCKGELSTPGKRVPAHADFALRFNNRTALIQRSNMLPVGERLNYTDTPAAYTMTYRVAPQGTRIVALPGWFSQTILVLHPDLQRLNQIRMSIDRQSGALEGEVLNERDQPLTTFAMKCEVLKEAAEPKL